MNSLFPEVAKKNLHKIAIERAKSMGMMPDEVIKSIEREFEMAGSLAFSFDSGTVPAIKQMRHKLLMANAGSMCFEGDEVGSNFTNNTEVLNAFLELYDIGKAKVKLTKNTTDNQRNEDIEGRTPTNLLLFGTPAKLLTSRIEDDFYNMLETGYARRLLFGYSQLNTGSKKSTALDMYNDIVNSNMDARMLALQETFKKLAGLSHFNKTLTMSKDTSIALIEYRLDCEKYSAANFKDHQEIQKAEMNHRYYKAMKLAGAYAFVDSSPTLEKDHLNWAIQITQDSGIAFDAIMKRDRNYVRVAKYLADINQEVTQVDLMEDVPAYKGSESQKRELIQLAIAWGYKHNIIIRRNFNDEIEFFIGEALTKTNLDEMILSYSSKITEGYVAETRAPFSELYKLTTADNQHYTAHRFNDGYRSSEKVIKGFNMLILDVDGGTNMDTAHLLMQDFVHMLSTTKRHTEAKNRFRVIIPLSHIIYLDSKGYSEFMMNVFAWLPFDVDEATKDIARKWESCKGASYVYNTKADLLDATLFIPQTKKATTQRKYINDNSSMTNLERWFILRTEEGNRSNMLVKYGFALLDNGYTLNATREAVLSFNSKLESPLPEEEILITIMISLTKKSTEMER